VGGGGGVVPSLGGGSDSDAMVQSDKILFEG
jgi:hypothetical protein